VQRAEDLAELEKQVIAATWKVIRRETAPEPTKDLVPDAKLIEESPIFGHGNRALHLRISSRMIGSIAFLETVMKEMNQAVEQLKAAQAGPSAAPLTTALAFRAGCLSGYFELRARDV